MSVVVVHRDGWAACDSRCTLGDSLVMPMSPNKAFVSSGWLTGVVGNGAMQTQLQRVQASAFEHEVLDKLSEFLMEVEAEGHALMVDKHRNFVHLDGLGSLDLIQEGQDFFSIGCAGQYVMGYLNRIAETEGRVVVPEDAQKAIESAAKFDCGIDGRVKVFYLNA